MTSSGYKSLQYLVEAFMSHKGNISLITISSKNVVCQKHYHSYDKWTKDVSLWEWSSERCSALQEYSGSFAICYNYQCVKRTYSVNRVCQFMQVPLETHWQVAKRILRHLAGTLNIGMTLWPSPSFHMVLEGFCDADWTSGPDDRRFTPGFCIYLVSNLVYWHSMKRHCFKVQYWSQVQKPCTMIAEITCTVAPHHYSLS